MAATACGGSGSGVGTGPTSDAGSSGSTSLDGGSPSLAGIDSVSGSAGVPSSGGTSGSDVGGSQGKSGSSGAESSSGGSSGTGSPGGGGSSGAVSVSGGSSGGSQDSPYVGCQRDLSSECGSPGGVITFKFIKCAMSDPSSECVAVPSFPGEFCCQRDSLGCSVQEAGSSNLKCGGSSSVKMFCGTTPVSGCRPYLYSGCTNAGNPDPSQCTPTNALNNEFCCSGAFLF